MTDYTGNYESIPGYMDAAFGDYGRMARQQAHNGDWQRYEHLRNQATGSNGVQYNPLAEQLMSNVQAASDFYGNPFDDLDYGAGYGNPYAPVNGQGQSYMDLLRASMGGGGSRRGNSMSGMYGSMYGGMGGGGYGGYRSSGYSYNPYASMGMSGYGGGMGGLYGGMGGVFGGYGGGMGGGRSGGDPMNLFGGYGGNMGGYGGGMYWKGSGQKNGKKAIKDIPGHGESSKHDGRSKRGQAPGKAGSSKHSGKAFKAGESSTYSKDLKSGKSPKSKSAQPSSSK